VPLWMFSLAVAALMGGTVAASAQKPLSGGQKGMLTVSIKVEGSSIEAAKFDNRVKRNWTVLRQAQFQIPFVGQMTTAWDLLAAKPAQAPVARPAPVKGQAEMGRQVQAALAACREDDDACMEAAVKKIAAQNAGKVEIPSQPPEKVEVPDFTRYQTWIADRSATCFSGTASISETMSGTQIPDNGDALWAVESTRDGETKLPASANAQQACGAQISFDLKKKTYTLLLGGMNIAIPATFHIQRKGFPKSQPFKQSFSLFEYTDIPLRNNELRFPNLNGSVSGFEGSITLPSRKSFQTVDNTVTPNVVTTIQWGFKPN
jgi:hypothetical protein